MDYADHLLEDYIGGEESSFIYKPKYNDDPVMVTSQKELIYD